MDVDSMKALAETKREIILSELIASHPKPLTVKDIVDNTHIAVSTIRKALKGFEHNKFIIPYEEPRRRGKRKTDKRVIRKPEIPFVLENANFYFNSLNNFKYQFSPGYVQYTKEFLQIYPTLVNRDLQNRVNKLFIKSIEEAFYRIHNSTNRISKVLSLKFDNGSLCPNCGFNHEARDLIRAILIYSIDRLEMTNEFIELLEKQHLITDEVYSRLKEGVTTLDPVGTSLGERSENIRLLSVNLTKSEASILFMAINDSRKFVYGDMKGDIAKDLAPGMIIKCNPSVMDERPSPSWGPFAWLYASIGEDDDVRILPSNLPIPTFSDVKSTIREIMPQDSEDFSSMGNIYFLEGFVTESPTLVKRYIHGRAVDAIDVNIAGVGGLIRLVGHVNDGINISEGDLIQVNGAIPVCRVNSYPDSAEDGHIDSIVEEIVDVQLRLSPYGSITKLERPDPKLPGENSGLDFKGYNRILRDKDNLLMAYVREFIRTEEGVRNSIEVVPTLRFYEYLPELKSIFYSARGSEHEYQIKRYKDGSIKKIKISKKVGLEQERPGSAGDEELQHHLSLIEPALENKMLIDEIKNAFTRILDKYYSSSS